MHAIYLISDENLSDIAGLQAQRLTHQWNCDVHIFIERKNTDTQISFIADHPQVFYHYEELSAFLPSGLPSTKKWPDVVYLRLFAPKVLQKYDRLLYVDADVLSMKSDPRIWDLDLPAGIGAVSDIATLERAPYDLKGQSRTSWLADIGVTSGRYMNSGVLLLDVAKIQEIDFAKELKTYFEAYPLAARFDQDFLASFFDGTWTELSPRMNFQAYVLEMGLTECIDPVLVHFCRQSKPWHSWPSNGWRCPTAPIYTRLYLEIIRDAGLNPDDYSRANHVNAVRRAKYWCRQKLSDNGITTKRSAKALAEWRANSEAFRNFYNQSLSDGRFADDTRHSLPQVADAGYFDGRFARSLESTQ